MQSVIPLRRQSPLIAARVQARVALTVPLMSAAAACGFPSPADDYLDSPLDFNELLIENPPATFVVRVAGDSMIGIGLYAGDLAVVNRAKTAVDRSIVVALVDLWPHPPGTLRALRRIIGHHYVICKPCKRYTDMEIPTGQEERKFDPCPYRCIKCRQRGELVAAVPEGFRHIHENV